MFTGIVWTVGSIVSVQSLGKNLRLHIGAKSLADKRIQAGDSVAVNGVCLTVAEWLNDGFYADVSEETLSCTNIGQLTADSPVNLELPLMPDSYLGGHFVSGHVDGLGEIVSRLSVAGCEQFWVRAPENLLRYIAVKGSITVDGVSLTVNAVVGDQFQITIIPHTLNHTIIHAYQPEHQVNLEVDLIARYLERLLPAGSVEGGKQ